MEFTQAQRNLFNSMFKTEAEGGRGYPPVNEEECRIFWSDLHPDKEDYFADPDDQEKAVQQCISELQPKKCDGIIPYEKYTPTILPSGWKQEKNDCWLDSLLYVMFVSGISQKMSESLDKMYKSDSENTKDLAKNVYNYLQGINNDYEEWAINESCKQILKKNIYNNIRLYYEENEGSSKYYFGAAHVSDASFTVNRNGYVGSGTSSPLCKIFADIDNSIVYKESSDKFCSKYTPRGDGGLIGRMRTPYLSQVLKITEDVNNQENISSLKTLVITLQYLGAYCEDVSSLEQLERVKGWKLQGIVLGTPTHYTSYVFANKKWYYYNNMDEPTLQELDKILEIKPFSVNYQELILFYERTLRGGTRKIKRSKKYRKSRRGIK
jgi:hypothetical protein